jgi:flagella basal body P-ring formation protein FlgA
VNLFRSLFVFVCLACFGSVVATEPICLRLREQPVVEGQVVYVGDLIEVVTGRCQQTDELLQLPIAPTPREGSPQTWTRSDVVKHLELRGLHATAIRWMGSERTQLRRGKRADGNAASNSLSPRDSSQPTKFSQTIPGRTQVPAFIQERAVQQAEMLLGQAITEYITLKSGDRIAWRVALSVPPEFVSIMQVKSNIVSIGGGKEPWEGEQNFVFEVKDRGALVRVPIKATLQLPPMVVVSKRALGREEIITADDLDYSPIPQRSAAAPSDFFMDIEEVVGKQVRRSIATGQPIEAKSVGNAMVVTRGDMIEVESVVGDIVVTTSGRANESGAVGELIAIELLPSRKRINASVTAPMKVRVSAVSARTKK